MSNKGNGEQTAEGEAKAPLEGITDARAIQSGDMVMAMFFCLQNEFGLVQQLEMMQMAPPQQQQDLKFQMAFKDSQAKLAEVKEAREKLVAEFNERFASIDAMRLEIMQGEKEETLPQ